MKTLNIFIRKNNTFTIMNTKHNFEPLNRHSTNIKKTAEQVMASKSIAAVVKGASSLGSLKKI